MRSLRLCLVFSLAAAAFGCGAHLHRPQDAATAESAAGELKDAKLTDGFAPELAQAEKMLEQELAVVRAWAQQGRDRDLLDVLAATAADEHDPDAEILIAPRCRGRFVGEGWTTLCAKLVARLAVVGGVEVPAMVAAPKPTRGKQVAAPAGPDPMLQTATTLRGLLVKWRADEAQLARIGTEWGTQARTRGLSPGPAPRCPSRPVNTADPGLAEVARRHAGLCATRRGNLVAIQAAARGQLADQATRALAVYDAVAVHDAELARRIAAYEQVKRPCTDAAANTACDVEQVAQAFAAMGDIPAGQALVLLGYEALAREGRAAQLAAQVAALDELIEARQIDKRSQSSGVIDGNSTPLALALHRTIEGIERVKAVTDAFEVTVLTLIRETLRVELAAVTTASGHAERRRRIALSKLAAQLDETTTLAEAFVRLQRLANSGCTDRPLVAVQAVDACRDDTTRALQALSNAWTLGRTAQREADALDLAVRHAAGIDRSRAAMAMREVYLAAGVAELVKFNQGGLSPEVLALLIVNAVGFGIVAGGVY